jgi:hypothetical protein
MKHVRCIEAKRSIFGVLVGNVKGRDHYEGMDTNVKMILKCILMKQSGRLRTGFVSFRRGASSGL